MRRMTILSTIAIATIAMAASAAGPQLRSSHAVHRVKRAVKVNDAIQRLQLTYTMDQLQAGVEVGAEYCMACHRDKAGWHFNTHARELRRAMPQYSLVKDQGVIADFDGNSVDDFQQGLDFNRISSVFDPYKPNAPILSVENGRYFITIGEDKLPVAFTIGGNGKAAQMFVVRVPVTDTLDHLSQGNYVAPIEFDERTNQYVPFNPGAWYDQSTGLPKFDATTDSATLAAGNSNSFADKCASCHASGVRDLHRTAAGEWVYTPYPATLVVDGDPAYFDVNHDGILDVVNVQCESCHGPGSAHILGGGDPARIINPNDLDASQSDQLCSQCHCDDKVNAPDHPAVEACPAGAHHETQADVASELSEERVGQTPDEVVNGSDAESCIACHAPTAVLKNGGMNETEALDYFFTTANGAFAPDTASKHTSAWPDVSCIACHDQHDPAKPAYFNSSTGKHEPMGASELCGQCHGSLRFADTDHLSYNIEQGTGGIGIPNQLTMPGVGCVDCHMYTSDVDGSTSSMFHGHSWAVAVHEEDGSDTVACSKCHPDVDTVDDLNLIINLWRENFEALDALAQHNATAAAAALQGVDNDALKAKLDEAQHNLAYAESDESNGFHNHLYQMSLLYDANNRAVEILDALKK